MKPPRQPRTIALAPWSWICTDAHNKQLIWRGVASNTLSDKPDKNEKTLDKSVDKMLKDFPPKGGR